MSRRAVLWVAFVVVHVGVAVLGFVMPNQPMGDVTNVYDPWSSNALNGNGIVGIDESWVYPQLAIIPMVLTQGLAWIAGYEAAWAILITAVDALAFAVLVGRGRSTGRTVAAWFWLSSIALLGPVGMYRLDGLTVPLAIAGCLWLVGRPWLASVVLSVATWMKVWPAALLAAALIAIRRRGALIGGAVAVSALTLAAVFAAGGGSHAFGFITDQADRGLQVEAPVSMLYVWRTAFGIEGSFIYYDRDLLTFQATGPNVDILIAVMTPLMAVVVLAVAALGAHRAWRGASFARLFPPLALAFVLALIVFNKVGSPQYMTWFVAPIVMGLVLARRMWWREAVLALVAAFTTQIIYPLIYWDLITAQPFAVIVLTVRNALLVVMFVWSVVLLVRVPTRRIRHAGANLTAVA